MPRGLSVTKKAVNNTLNDLFGKQRPLKKLCRKTLDDAMLLRKKTKNGNKWTNRQSTIMRVQHFCQYLCQRWCKKCENTFLQVTGLQKHFCPLAGPRLASNHSHNLAGTSAVGGTRWVADRQPDNSFLFFLTIQQNPLIPETNRTCRNPTESQKWNPPSGARDFKTWASSIICGLAPRLTEGGWGTWLHYMRRVQTIEQLSWHSRARLGRDIYRQCTVRAYNAI